MALFPSSCLLRTMQTCWSKQVHLQQWNIIPLTIFWLKNATDLVRMHPAVYQMGSKTGYGVEQIMELLCQTFEPSPTLVMK
jgi:hypothetical protein